MELAQLYSLFLQYPVISTDTRKISPNSLFFALKGANFNGNTFALKALEAGAAYAVVDEPSEKEDARLILVEDVLVTLQKLAHYHRQQLNIPVIAIVGSNGKTTTKELIYSVLSQKFNALATPGNFNNHIGLPLTLLMLNQTHEVAIIEMGANHEGENKLLCEIANPSHGIVTNNGKDHLEGFGDLQGVIRSNKELYDYFVVQNQGVAFVNAADRELMVGSTQIKNRITYCANTAYEAKYQAHVISLQPNIECKVNEQTFKSSLSGDYNLENIMAALSIGYEFGLSSEQISEGIAQYKPQNLRSEYLETARNKIFLDAYNANPSSMEASIRNFAALPGENKLLILGDMFELGKYEAEEHQNIVDYCHKIELKNVALVGNAFSATKTDFLQFSNISDLISDMKLNQLKGYFVFLKGSRGMRLETLVEHL